MDRSKMIVYLGLFFNAAFVYANDVPESCMRAYDEGGAPSFFKLPECPQSVFSAIVDNKSSLRADNCEFASIQGHRKYQEDRVVCYPNVVIPVLGVNGAEEVSIGVAAVFDGHGGDEASKMASEKFLDYFLVHVVFNTHNKVFRHKSDNEETDINSFIRESYDGELLHGVLEKALLQTIRDIDLEFSLEAVNNGYVSGSTVTVVLLVNEQILVGFVGDSKALLCSRRYDSKLYAEELTRDHHPDREDEKSRIEASGGFIRVWGVPRVNGILALSRSIGDIYLKRYGVIAEPEVTWRNLTSNDYYIVIASDGVFETMAPQSVCDILQAQDNSVPDNSPLCSSRSSLAGCVVNKAFDEGSTDNLSVILIPLKKNATV